MPGARARRRTAWRVTGPARGRCRGPTASPILQELTCLEDPAADTDSYCTSPSWIVTQTIRLAPQTAACTGCHDAPYAVTHAQLNTSASGAEACATCHGPGKSWDVESVHSR